MGKSYVYVISVNKNGPCKIGHAANVLQRFWQIKSANHQELTLSAVFETESPYQAILFEGLAHTEVFDKRIRGEWFDITAFQAIDVVTKLGLLRVKAPAWKRPKCRAALPLDPVEAQRVLELYHPRWR